MKENLLFSRNSFTSPEYLKFLLPAFEEERREDQFPIWQEKETEFAALNIT